MAENIAGMQVCGKGDGDGRRKKQKAENSENWLQFSYYRSMHLKLPGAHGSPGALIEQQIPTQ